MFNFFFNGDEVVMIWSFHAVIFENDDGFMILRI